MRTGYLSLGSNVGDRLANISAAIDHLAQNRDLNVIAASSVYETEPVGEILDQRSFLNACLEIETELQPEQLLDECKAVEIQMGRDMQAARHSPRPIDIDLLLLGDTTFESQRLRIPHREVTSRRFVLVPLLELKPELIIPGVGAASDCLAALHEENGVELFASAAAIQGQSLNASNR